MARVEMIWKKSTLEEVKETWEGTGRVYNGEEGQAVFEDVDGVEFQENGDIIKISKGDSIYLYNMNDFYRIKVINGTEE